MVESSASDGSRARSGRALAILCALMGATALVRFAFNVEHYWFLLDDAFISFRYASNLVGGHGLVWNPGEYVEGYTNFLWVILVAGGMLAGLQPEGFSALLSIACALGLLATLIRFSAGRESLRDPFVWLPLLALASSRTFAAWSTSGMETMLFALLVVGANLRFVVERERAERERAEREDAARSPMGSIALFTLATLTRPEGGLFTFVAGVFFLADALRGRRRFASLCLWCLPWFVVIGSHFLWRHAYYGYWLPNTFYAKVNGIWLEQGLHFFEIFQQDYKFLYFLPFALLAVAGWRSFAHLYLANVILVYSGYLLLIGGDRFEFRPLVAVLPLFYWLVCEGLRWIHDQGWRRGGAQGRALLALSALCAILLVGITEHGSRHYAAFANRYGIESLQSARFYGQRRSEEGRFLASQIEQGVLPDDLLLCAGGAGALPYYTRWPTLDYRGLNDPVIAHEGVGPRAIIGHEHYASRQYMEKRGVEVFDVRNQLVVSGDPTRFRGKRPSKNRIRWPLHAVRLEDGKSMVFGTTVSEEDLRKRFGKRRLLF
ncbi:MAG: hypothetical protein JRG96_00915 [Deltaproteobacteria bacterium]|nr:hypothetical protein [Deltaproteobacteria bacterium]MBW2420342.1 hypothetical protein [Deltaproteobacteria bacterium]